MWHKTTQCEHYLCTPLGLRFLVVHVRVLCSMTKLGKISQFGLFETEGKHFFKRVANELLFGLLFRKPIFHFNVLKSFQILKFKTIKSHFEVFCYVWHLFWHYYSSPNASKQSKCSFLRLKSLGLLWDPIGWNFVPLCSR